MTAVIIYVFDRKAHLASHLKDGFQSVLHTLPERVCLSVRRDKRFALLAAATNNFLKGENLSSLFFLRNS